MKTFLHLLFLIILLYRCQSSKLDDKGNTLHSSSKKDLPVAIKSILINSSLVENASKKENKNYLTESEKSNLILDSIDNYKIEGFKYLIIDTLVNNPYWQSLLIARLYADENIIWLANYSNNNALIDFKQVYYDNSEGSISEKTEIQNNEIIISSLNEFLDIKDQNKKSRYYLTHNGMFTEKR